MPFLEIHDADGVRKMPLEGDQLTIGRLPTSGLVIDSRGCSKQHCRLERRGRQWRAVDLASANGTSVNGRAISQVVLEDGDEVVIGSVSLTFRRGSAAAGAASTSAAGARRSPNTPALIAVVAVLAVVGVILAFRGGGHDEAVDANGDESAAVIGGVPGESGAPAESPPPEKDVDPTRAAFATLGERDDLPFEELDAALRELAATARDPDLRREIDAHRTGARERFETRYRDELAIIGEEAGAAALRGEFCAALDRLTAFVAEADAVGAGRVATEARRRRLDVVKQARGDWDTLHGAVASLTAREEFAEARARVRRRIADFRGTRFEAFAHSELQLIDLGESEARQRRAAAAAATAGAAPRKGRHAAVALIGEAENLAASRRWAAAGARYAEALALVEDDELRARWTPRRDTLDALGHLKSVVVEAVNDERKVVRTVRIGRLQARLAHADEETVELTFARTGRVTWKWKDVPAEQLVDLLSFGARKGEARFAFAIACHEFGRPDQAVEVLADVAGEKSFKVRADRVYARWRGIDVPAGGFIVEDGAFYTFEEHQRIEAAKRARVLARTLVKAGRDRFREIAFELKEMGDVAHDPFQEALRRRHAEVLRRYDQLAVVRRVSTARQQLQRVLDERRTEALELIFDTKRYPYPYGPGQAKVQGEVNALVDRVRSVYEHPSRELLETSKALAELDAELRELVGFMLPRGEEPVPDGGEVLARLDALIDLRTHGLGRHERKVSDEALRFNAEIKSSITPHERELHRLTNEYRIMMGRQAVKIDEALVRAARGHSQEMKDLGYFAHDSPVAEHRTPSMRARLAGWGGSCSENIARGSPTPALALQGWINSSGHHRNVLGRGHTHLGCGKAKDGAFWTQNFATGSSSSISREKIDPEDRAGEGRK